MIVRSSALLLLGGLVLLLLVHPSEAHIRYVLNQTEIQRGLSESPLGPGYQTSAIVMLLVLFLVVAAQFMIPVVSTRPFARRFESVLLSQDHTVPVFLRIGTGVFLVFSGLSGMLFSPQAGLNPSLDASPISLLQTLTGLLLIIGFLTKIAALLLALLVVWSFQLVGPDGLDYFFLLGVAIVLFFEGGLRVSVDRVTIARLSIFERIGRFLARFKSYSMPALRITLGTSLIWLALTEKLLVPQLTIIAVMKYKVPVYPDLLAFVFFFGFLEAILGGHYLLGIFNRLVSAVYLLLLISAIFLFGETLNHLPLFAVAIAFLIRGAGPYGMQVTLKKGARETNESED